MVKRNKIHSFQVKINGDDWTVRFLPYDSYLRKHGEDSRALTEDERKYIDFQLDAFTPRIARHETVHAYAAYMCLDDANEFTFDQVTEILATFNEKNHEKIDKTTLEIVNLYKTIGKPDAV